MAKWDLSKLPEGRKPLPDEWFAERAQMQDRIKELEAKLAKAELIVRIIASDKWNERLGEVVDLSCEYLAELTGGKDE